MKTVLTVLLLSALAIAGTTHNPADYNVTIHVTGSRIVLHHAYFQQLTALIDGKQCELESQLPVYGFLILGDYKAKLVDDRHKPTYDSWQIYELLLPDNKTRRFVVMEVKP